MIVQVGWSLLAIGVFALVLWRSRIAAVTDGAVRLSMSGVMSMLDGELDDDDKERAVRRAGAGLVLSALGIAWRLALALASAAAPVVLADALGLASREAVLDLMLEPWYLVAVSVAAIVVAGRLRRRRPPPAGTATSEDRYSTTDRFVHAVAFSTPGVLKAASRIEDRLLPGSAREPSGPPIFVTSVARAGTTALLNALAAVPGVATHTYRDMPFLTAPTLWNRLAGGDRRRVGRHERAHGDGLEIGLDSPEAFEEVIWRMFWPEKYRGPIIGLWRSADRLIDAEEFLRRHMAKIIGARLGPTPDDAWRSARYCSKDNTNIARLDYLPEAFPGCHVVVPIRRPDRQAASLLRQHQNFLAQQTEDDFTRRYMRDIGHFEFGRIHKPIAFPGFDADRHAPGSADYWLDYWIHAFRHVLERSDDVVLVTQDDLRAAPQETLTGLCEVLGLPSAPAQFADYFHAAPDESRSDLFDPRLYDEATEVYRELEARTLSAG